MRNSSWGTLRIWLASAAFGRLKNQIWPKREISKPLKVRLYKVLNLPTATYASVTWTIKSEHNRKLEAFEMRCLRAISGVKLRDRVRNEAVINIFLHESNYNSDACLYTWYFENWIPKCFNEYIYSYNFETRILGQNIHKCVLGSLSKKLVGRPGRPYVFLYPKNDRGSLYLSLHIENMHKTCIFIDYF